jgi:hypothetical protein
MTCPFLRQLIEGSGLPSARQKKLTREFILTIAVSGRTTSCGASERESRCQLRLYVIAQKLKNYLSLLVLFPIKEVKKVSTIL